MIRFLNLLRDGLVLIFPNCFIRAIMNLYSFMKIQSLVKLSLLLPFSILIINYFFFEAPINTPDTAFLSFD